MNEYSNVIGVIGLGYVGLPLAVEFSKIQILPDYTATKNKVIGYDINRTRIDELKEGIDSTNEISKEQLECLPYLNFTSNLSDLAKCNVYIITVPTPVNSKNKPDLTPLLSASEVVGSLLKEGDYVIYESTVYPGCTEEECIPVLESNSGLVCNKHFFVGYSPERINPGDKLRGLTDIVKVTSGSNPAAADFINDLYSSIIKAGTFKAKSIKVAESAKLIENVQRDVNIALMNELSAVFNELNIDTKEVLEAAGTKWNFMQFSPGLVGGHCIGVDPYYLIDKANKVRAKTKIVESARMVNEQVPSEIVSNLMADFRLKEINPKDANVLIFGFTFKENCPDIRNTKVADLVSSLKSRVRNVDCVDYLADELEVLSEYGIQLINPTLPGQYDAIILAVPHKNYSNSSTELTIYQKSSGIFYDLKGVFDKCESDFRL